MTSTPSSAQPARDADLPRASPNGSRDVVQLTLPAASQYLTVLRTATASLAARLDFTLDDIEDLRIAVDEACALLLVSAVPGSSLTCEFILAPEVMRVSVTVHSLDGEPPSTDTFAWTVLTALAGEVASSTGADGQVTLELAKRRQHRVEGNSEAGTLTGSGTS